MNSGIPGEIGRAIFLPQCRGSHTVRRVPSVAPVRHSRTPPITLTNSPDGLPSAHVAFGTCAAAILGLAALNCEVQHWFVLPLLGCGVLVGADAVDWLRGKRDLMDPAGVLGILGLHFFFLAPLLHVVWQHWMSYVVPPPDWRPWLGAMAFLNLLGLFAYRVGRHFGARMPRRKRGIEWRLNRSRFFDLLSLFLPLTAGVQLFVFYRYGGLSGYMDVYAKRYGDGSGFAGMGWVFMISESFPILAFMLFAVVVRKTARPPAWCVVAIGLFSLFVLQFFAGGLRGSRSNTVAALFWGVGIVHLWLRPLPKKIVAAGLVLLVGFMYLYGFYKALGSELFRMVREEQVTARSLEEVTGRTFQGAILGDLGRTDVQAFMLYRLLNARDNYEYALGRTYLGSLALLIPRAAWPDRPPTKVKEGTEVQYGSGAYVPGEWVSSRVYGLAGEAMLNFGPWSVPAAFLVFGLAIGAAGHRLSGLTPTDSRRLIAPCIVLILTLALGADSDNILFGAIKRGAVPFALVFLSSTRLPRRPSYQEGFRMS